MEMIALDNQPFAIVNDISFGRIIKTAMTRYVLPSDFYVREKILPNLHNALKACWSEKLHGVHMVSGWTT